MEKRRKLKGSALRAIAIREMAQMLRMLHRDAFSEELPEPQDVGVQIFRHIPDVRPSEDPLRSLELIANDFHVNPRPRLVLFVEGETEEVIIPILLYRLYGAGPSVFGIEIVNLGGIENAAGGKKNRFSSLVRLVDYLHHHQTIAFVLMDNEGYAKRNLQEGLPSAWSTYFPDRRATRREYVKLWKKSFEFDNFKDREIARAMSVTGDAKFRITEVSNCRKDHQPSDPKTANSLKRLFKEKTGRDLDKRALACALVDEVFPLNSSHDWPSRPITHFLDQITERAALNHQPTMNEIWLFNQRTGHLGTLKQGAIARRKPLFGRSRVRKRPVSP